MLRKENVASAIVGASRPAQIRENEATAEIDLDADTLAQIESVPETTAPR